LEGGLGIAVNEQGEAYVTGSTWSSEASFPVIVGPDLSLNGDGDAFVAKVNATGTALLLCGYIGGSGFDSGAGIALGPAGSIYVTGWAESNEDTFPVTGGPDLSYNGGRYDAFIAKMDAAGAALLYCGYIGGYYSDGGQGIAVDGAGSAYVTGWTESLGDTFPVTVGPDLSVPGPRDGFVAKVNMACLHTFGLACGGSDARRNDDQGSADDINLYSCTNRPETGPEVVYLLSSETPASVSVTLSGLSADLDILVLGGQPSCSPGNCIAMATTP